MLYFIGLSGMMESEIKIYKNEKDGITIKISNDCMCYLAYISMDRILY